MDSKRWETANGQNPAADSLYDPHGNDWYVCAIYGSGASSYADFGIYCACFGPAIHPNGRPYFPRYGRWLSPDSPLLQDLLDPNDLNAYGYDDGDPIDNADPGNGAGPTQPPVPGSDDLQRALDWLRDQLNANTCTSFGCYAVNAGLGFTEGLGYGLAADTAAPAVARAAAAAGPAVTAAASTAATAVGTAAATYGPQAVQAVTDFNEGMEQPYIPAENFAGKLGQFFGFVERMLD